LRQLGPQGITHKLHYHVNQDCCKSKTSRVIRATTLFRLAGGDYRCFIAPASLAKEVRWRKIEDVSSAFSHHAR
jgi:hypothetical protein